MLAFALAIAETFGNKAIVANNEVTLLSDNPSDFDTLCELAKKHLWVNDGPKQLSVEF